MTIKTRPYNLLPWTGLIFTIIALLVIKKGSIIDIHLHDTYFVLEEKHIFFFFTILLLFIWTIYFFTKRFLLSAILTWTHVIVTILTFILIAQIFYLGHSLPNSPRYYNDFSNGNFYNPFDTKYRKAIGIIVYILMFGQFIYIINLLGGIFKRLNFGK